MMSELDTSVISNTAQPIVSAPGAAMGVPSAAMGVPDAAMGNHNGGIPHAPALPVVAPQQENSTATYAETANMNISEDEDETPVEQENQLTNSLYLRFQGYCKPFDLLDPKPMYAAVAHKAMQIFAHNLENVIEKRVASERIYKIEVIEPVPREGWEFEIMLRNKVVVVPLYYFDPPPRRNTNNRQTEAEEETRPKNDPNNIVLTFAGAGERHLLHIENLLFDKVIQNTLNLTLVKCTERQVNKEVRNPNGNKYCVVERPANLAIIPPFLFVRDPTTNKDKRFNILYGGRPKKCFRCEKFHADKCPEVIAFEIARDERNRLKEEKEIKTKIYSDSTMRLADPMGLKAEVCAMSGGGLGQLATSAFDDPEEENIQNIIILGGNNDIKNPTHQEGAEFAFDIDGSIEKIAALAEQENTKTVTVVTLERQNQKEPEDINRIAKVRYIGEKVKETIFSKSLANLNTVNVKYESDPSGHPTHEGTADILKQIDNFVGNKLIWNENFILAKKMYQRCQSIFRYGCNHCDLYGAELTRSDTNNTVCTSCEEAVKNKVRQEPNELWNKIHEEVRLEKMKRTRDDVSDDSENDENGNDGSDEKKGKVDDGKSQGDDEFSETNTDPVTDPVTDPATDPANDPVTEPVTDPVTTAEPAIQTGEVKQATDTDKAMEEEDDDGDDL